MSAGRFIVRHWLACAAVALLAACGQSADDMATDDPTAASAQQLPDWSGWWEMEGGYEAVRAASQSGGEAVVATGCLRPLRIRTCFSLKPGRSWWQAVCPVRISAVE